MEIQARDEMTFADALILFFTAPLRLRTYTNLLYLMLAFPLGLLYFIFLIVGLSTGFGLVIVWIGIPILAAVFAGSWWLAALERQIAIHALGADVPPMAPPPGSERAAGFWQRLGAFFSNPVTWKGMAFLMLKFPLGIASFVAVVTSLSTSAALLLAPVVWLFGGEWAFEIDFYWWTVDSLGGAMIVGAFGAVGFFISLNLLNGLALFWRWTATFLLGSERFMPAAPMAPPALPAPAAA
jgi:hypothetical protein